MKKKLLPFLISLILSVSFMQGCGGKGVYVPLAYKDNGPIDGVSQTDYNKSLFYRNDLTTLAADPSAIYITQGSEKGYFYLYATSDQIGVSGYQCWRSKDLVNWECRGVAFNPSRDSWALRDYWAPEVIYDEALDTYFMYYNATDLKSNVKSIGLATSKTPYGPFVQYVDEEKGITLGTALFDFTKMSNDDPLTEKNGAGEKVPMKVIDASPFIDPDSGDKYMYFVHDLGGGGNSNNYAQSSIYGIKLTDWYTPDYTFVRKLLTPNALTIDAVADPLTMGEGNVNEGPFMYKRGDKYYLTYSVNAYTDKAYSVRTSVGDSAMGPFTKLTKEEGGFLLAADMSWDHASGTGHHSFATVGEELFIIYHAHTDREMGGTVPRGIAGDKVFFIDNKDGLPVPYTNGPTYSPQPLAAEISGYKNVTDKATVTADNTALDSDVKFLGDGLIKFHSYAVTEYTANSGKSVIKLTFDNYIKTRAIMVFNSYDFDMAFDHIDKIEFAFKSGETLGTAYTERVSFDWNTYCTAGLNMRPGGSFIVEYAELLTKSITITINNGDNPFAVSEIVVLGK